MKEKTPDRRPITARKNNLSKKISTLLAKLGVSSNSISIMSIVFSIGASICLLKTTSVFSSPLLWLSAALLILLRLLANMFDGMVAVETDSTSAIGNLYNEIPDRISDVLIFISAGYATGDFEFLGYIAATFSLFVAYIRALGNDMGVTGLFSGPMAKSHRMFTLIGICLYNTFFQSFFNIPELLSYGLSVIILGCLVTSVLRLQRIVKMVSK